MDTQILSQDISEQAQELPPLSLDELEMIAGGECVVNNI